MTTTVFLVRHAAHDNLGSYLAGRTPGVRLGAEGRAQAERLGRRMARETVDAIYASPRERTQETAAAIVSARETPLALHSEDALDEIDFGRWSGSTWDALNRDDGWRRWNAARSLARTPGGESMLDVQHRVWGLVDRLTQRHPDGSVVLVTHADIIKTAVSHVLGLPIDAWPRLEVGPASISTIVVGDWGGKLITLNQSTD